MSAFSHAFSGFAGESPTRYRSLGTVRRAGHSALPDAPQPAWTGELEPVEFAFIRAKGTGRGTQSSIREALDLIQTRVGPLKPAASNGSEANGVDASAPFIAACFTPGSTSGRMNGLKSDSGVRLATGGSRSGTCSGSCGPGWAGASNCGSGSAGDDMTDTEESRAPT